jgi:hypothetical protein
MSVIWINAVDYFDIISNLTKAERSLAYGAKDECVAQIHAALELLTPDVEPEFTSEIGKRGISNYWDENLAIDNLRSKE